MFLISEAWGAWGERSALQGHINCELTLHSTAIFTALKANCTASQSVAVHLTGTEIYCNILCCTAS